jgi:hypothetical protein
MQLLGYCCKLVVIKEQLCNYHVRFYVDWCNKSLILKKLKKHFAIVEQENRKLRLKVAEFGITPSKINLVHGLTLCFRLNCLYSYLIVYAYVNHTGSRWQSIDYVSTNSVHRRGLMMTPQGRNM